jgi:hypothetical protein
MLIILAEADIPIHPNASHAGSGIDKDSYSSGNRAVLWF